jgi:Fic family protein
LPVAQPVLVEAAKDLAELDGAKEIISIKDSIITTQDTRIATKDTIISKYVSKEINFKKIITNQDTQIQGWKGQYTKLEFQNKKLKLQNKFTKIAAIVVVGGLSYMMLMK